MGVIWSIVMQPSLNNPTAIRHVVVLCHPNEESFNAAVAAKYCEVVEASGQSAVVRDLYKIDFDPVLKRHEIPGRGDFHISPDVEAEWAVLGHASALVLVYPIWFGTPPAMLKGYVDRVLGSGFDHRSVRDRTHHRLEGKSFLSLSSSGNSSPWLEEQGAWSSLRYGFDAYLEHAFSMKRAEHVHFDSVVKGLNARYLDENLLTVATCAQNLCATLASRQRNRTTN
jgi:NAD(P)H dehydrogenase (quinone)